MTVGDICTRTIVTANPGDAVPVAARRMRDHHVGDLVVIDADRRPIGILTDRDIVVTAVAQSADLIDTLLVGDVMTADPLTSLTDESVEDALERMRAHGIRRMPVVDSIGELEGIVTFDDILESASTSLTDLVRLVAREQKQERTVRSG